MNYLFLNLFFFIFLNQAKASDFQTSARLMLLVKDNSTRHATRSTVVFILVALRAFSPSPLICIRAPVRPACADG